MRGLLSVAIAVLALLAVPGFAGAVRPATEQEIAEFKAAALVVENARCVHLRSAASDMDCPKPRADYEPTVSEARVSTMDPLAATARLAPAPRSSQAATAILRRDIRAEVIGPGRGTWVIMSMGNDCDLGQSKGRSSGPVPRLAPDLLLAMGCEPQVPTKVRCLDKFRIWLLALERPRQCAVAGPEGTPFAGWMNIRELRWHRWGDESKAWALGVIRELPKRLGVEELSAAVTGPAVSSAIPLPPIAVRLVASERVSCGTSHYYSRLRVFSPFGRFSVALPTCPDQFFTPR